MSHSIRCVFAACLLLACDKTAQETPPSKAKEATVPEAPASVAPLASTPTVTSAVPSATASAVPTIVVASTGDAGRAKAKPASKHIDGKNFALELASAGCKAGAECVMTLRLTAAGAYHVNKEYPYKFTANAAPGVEFLSKGAANTFTRAEGDFVEQGEKNGTMTVRFKPAAAGDANVSGTYKFSVCSADQCQIEQEKVELVVPVS